MKVRNAMINVAQFGVGFSIGLVASPFAYAGVAATVVKVAAGAVQVVSFKVTGELFEQAAIIGQKLEKLKNKDDIVQEPVGDEAIPVN